MDYYHNNNTIDSQRNKHTIVESKVPKTNYSINKVYPVYDTKTKEEREEIRKKEEEEELKKLKEIVGSYVFTADNFIKLILVLFRIQSGIPVIMMGETGCGKTSLIRIMSQLMGIKMKILNIHAGVNDNDILEFMLGKTKDNNQNLLDLEVEKKLKIITKKC